jgi:hypothetical protein
MPRSSPSIDINRRAQRYFVAQTQGVCGDCQRSTALVAVGLWPGHEVLELDDEALDDAHANDVWEVANHAAFLFQVAYLPSAAQSRITEICPAYALDHDESGDELYWANHCEHCAAPFDDQDLYCEPGGAFLPVSEADAGLIQLCNIDESFAAAAAGDAPEPPFFDSMRRD